jgi:hypothetical protein
MNVTLESLHAAAMANHLLLITLVRTSPMSPQIKQAFAVNAKQAREIGLATEHSDAFLADFDESVARILREI